MKPTGEPAQPAVQATGIRKSGMFTHRQWLTLGKQWKAKATPNKNPSLRTPFAKRIVKDKQAEATKALERQLKEERKAAEEVEFPFKSILANV